MNSLRVAVVGATGAVGEAMVEILRERRFPVDRLWPVASDRSRGQAVEWAGSSVPVETLEDFDFSRADLALFSAGGDVARRFAPRAVANGCTVIDNSSAFRDDENVPLVVPEVNGEQLGSLDTPCIIANPNCSTIQLMVALAPIQRSAGIERINVATYQSVSGQGRAAMEELARQTADRLGFRQPQCSAFPVVMAFNLLPGVGEIQADGFSTEEHKLMRESRRVLEAPELAVNASAARVPVFYGHAEAVHLETRVPLEIEQALELLRAARGVVLLEDGEALPTPVTHAAGSDAVFVARVRRDPTHPRGIDLWVMADNIRKGAALNAVQIAEALVESGRMGEPQGASNERHEAELSG